MPATKTYRTNADGSAVCPHRDLSVCASCAESDPNLVDVVGAYFHITDPAERDALRAELGAEARTANDVLDLLEAENDLMDACLAEGRYADHAEALARAEALYAEAEALIVASR